MAVQSQDEPVLSSSKGGGKLSRRSTREGPASGSTPSRRGLRPGGWNLQLGKKEGYNRGYS
jgi:hypothetical protein